MLLQATDEQRTAGWRQARAGCVTGSRFGSVMAFGKNGKELKERADYRMQLVVERLTGIPAKEINAASLDWGKENEPLAITAFEMERGVIVEPAGFTPHKDNEWIGVSPDGLVDDHAIIEVKCPANSLNHLMTIIHSSQALAAALTGSKDVPLSPIPEEHMPQVQGNMWVTGRSLCWFISYDPRMPPHLRLYTALVERDEAYVAKLEAATMKFLEEVEETYSLLMQP